MAFALSKLVHFLAQPLNTALAALALGLLLGRLGWRRGGRLALGFAALYAVVTLATPAPEALLGRLEARFPPPDAATLARATGVIVLGGSTDDGALAEARGMALTNGAGERLTAILTLMARRPDLPILHSGGSARVRHEGWREGEIVRRFLAEVGRDPALLAYEERSRTTHENAVESAALLAASPEFGPGPYLLVTSAWHMPRAVGAFRAAGLEVVAYPVDYRARPASWSLLRLNTFDRLDMMTRAMLEHVGLAAYFALGRSDALFPGPR